MESWGELTKTWAKNTFAEMDDHSNFLSEKSNHYKMQSLHNFHKQKFCADYACKLSFCWIKMKMGKERWPISVSLISLLCNK